MVLAPGVVGVTAHCAPHVLDRDDAVEPFTQAAAKDPKQLAEAFRLFNELSSQLADSYHTLEERIAHLNAELAAARSERLHQLAERERIARRLQSLLDALPAGVVVIDGGGCVQDANPTALALLDGPLVGEVWRDVIERAFAPRDDDGHDVSLVNGRRVSISRASTTEVPQKRKIRMAPNSISAEDKSWLRGTWPCSRAC